VAVDDLTLTVEQGEIYGFLGPNGAGKSTTINMMMDYIRPSNGTIRVLGLDPQTDVVDVHRRIGILPDEFSVYTDRTGREHLDLVIKTKRTNEDPVQLLEQVGIGEVIDKPAGSYSRGMRQRLALAMALVGDPELLILDEPFRGLDPRGIRTIRDIIHQENERGATVFFSSHVLGQVKLVCDRIGILHEGTLVEEGSLEQLRDAVPVGCSVRLTVNGALADAHSIASELDITRRVVSCDGKLVVHLNEGYQPSTVVDRLEEDGIIVTEIDARPPTIESIFLTHTDAKRGVN